MELLVSLFNTILYFPLFNALILLYNTVAFKDLGLAIIILTVLIRLALYPLSRKAIQSQKAINALQPQIKGIQKKHKDNKEEQARQMLALYKDHKVNPVSGCLPILIQLPILIALYRVFFTGLDVAQLNMLYSFVPRPESLNLMFLGLLDLSQRSVILAFLAGILQFIQSKMIMPKRQTKVQTKTGGLDFASAMTQQMTYFMPLMTVFIAFNLPAALPLYWTAITLFGIIQQRFTPRLVEEKIKS